MEQEEYSKEEIDWSYIEFIDNQDILDLIEKKPGGIIALLDEACMFPRSTNETFAQKLYQTFKNHKRFAKPKLSRSGFTICHYAGDVTYQTELFLDKNKDYVVPEHQALLSSSDSSFVSGLFPPLPQESSKTSKFSSIGSQFKQQLQALLETLNATEPHYIRCVKPNNLLKPGIFENSIVLQQLRCGGVMEAIRISCAGYPTRRTFDEFISRFKILEPSVVNGRWLVLLIFNSLHFYSCDEVNACRRLMDKVDLKGYQIGRTKVFLRAGQMAELDSHRSRVLGKSACKIQRRIRFYLDRKKFISLRMSAIQIQALCRGQDARHIYGHRRRTAAALIIQKDARTFFARKAYALLSSSAILIQAGMRGVAARNELWLRKKTKSAILIQSRCRGTLACCGYLRLKRAAIAAQCAWRAKLACKELRMLKSAAKETGALQEAKSKLEKEVEDLTWQLQLEKRMRADIEEVKNQETAKLASALEKMQVQFQETKDQLMKELETAKKLAGPATFIQDLPVIKDELVDKLSAENEKLKSLVSSLEKKIDETEKKYEETSKLSEDRLKQALEAETKIIQLKTTVQRLEEKLSDIEIEDEILHRQALKNSPAGKMSGHLVQTMQPVENGDHEPQSAQPIKRFGIGSDSKLRRSNTETQRENVDALIRCITEDLGFIEGKPVAAFTVYKCLVHWKSFEAEKTSVFDRLIQTIGFAIEDESNNKHMAYWLSNISTLLFLLQQTIKATGSTPGKPPQPTSFFGRMARNFRSASSANVSIGGLSGVCQVEAKYPALLFKQQLTAYVEKIYGIIRDNLKKELSSLLSLCIQAPRTLGGNSLKSSGSSLANHWQNIIESLNRHLNILKDNFVPLIFVQKTFMQIFSYINIQLFNSLLLHRECCTFSNGEYVKAGLGELELWCVNAREYAGSSRNELKHVQQAVGFLVIHQKLRITYEDLTTDLCPILSTQQLYKICNLYWDDDYNTRSVSPDVISSMKTLMKEDSGHADSNSFLLDDNSSIPFSVDDISRSLQHADFTRVKPPAELLLTPGFEFLQG
ncbi:myosin-6 isoform X2 [Sesamum indicum]|nr:myosin-6 isoform X2 [Sesamum indicum]